MISFIPKKSIGVDIADNSIEVVQLAEIGTSISVSSLSRVNLQPGIVKNGRIIKEDELGKALVSAMAEAKPKPINGKKIVFGFPESQTFFHIFSYKYLDGEKNIDKEKMDKIVLEEAWSNIPIVKNEMVVYYQILREHKDGVDFLIVAAMKRLVFEWQEFFSKLDLDVQTFDIEAAANYRSLAVESKKPVCIIDVGAATTNVYIFSKNKIIFEHTIDIGGEDFTSEIAKIAKLNEEDAEKKKIEVGLSNAEEIFFPALIKILEDILGEIKDVLSYFEKNSKTKIEKLIFIGGSSQLKGLTEFFENNLGLPAVLGESKYLDNKRFEFIGAVGMALRGMDKKIDDEDPVIPFVEEGDLKAEDKEGDGLYLPTSVDDEKNEVSEDKSNETKRSRKKILALIILVGIIMLGSAFYYRSQQRLKKQEAIKASMEKIDSITAIQNIDNSAASTTEQNKIDDSATSTIESPVDNLATSSARLVVVTDTEVGYLNVRSGAGKDFNVLTKVKPGEVYEFLESQGDWSKIRLSAEAEGWVANKYLQEKIK